MNTVHTVCKRLDASMVSELREFGIEAVPGLHIFDITEDDPAWPEVALWIKRVGASESVYTQFSQKEIDAADLLFVYAWQRWYPEPGSNYFELCYGLENYCTHCGIGSVQTAAFRLKGEPKWGRNNCTQLFWIEDELFVTPELWRSVFADFGIGMRPVLRHRTSDPLTTIVQLDIGELANSPLEMDSKQAQSTCRVCGRTRFGPISVGMNPPFRRPQPASLFKTQEFFGTGRAAWRNIMMSRELRVSLARAGAKGIFYRPVSAKRYL